MREYEINNSDSNSLSCCLSRSLSLSLCVVAHLIRESKECDGNTAIMTAPEMKMENKREKNVSSNQFKWYIFIGWRCMSVWRCAFVRMILGADLKSDSVPISTKSQHKINSYGNLRVDVSVNPVHILTTRSHWQQVKPLGTRFIKKFWHWRNVSVHDGNNGSTHIKYEYKTNIVWHRWTTNRAAWDHRVQSTEQKKKSLTNLLYSRPESETILMRTTHCNRLCIWNQCKKNCHCNCTSEFVLDSI